LHKEDLKESLRLTQQEEVALRKDHYISTVKTKGTWHENAIDLNDANRIEKRVIDRKPALIQDATDAMRWAM